MEGPQEERNSRPFSMLFEHVKCSHRLSHELLLYLTYLHRRIFFRPEAIYIVQLDHNKSKLLLLHMIFPEIIFFYYTFSNIQGIQE